MHGAQLVYKAGEEYIKKLKKKFDEMDPNMRFKLYDPDEDKKEPSDLPAEIMKPSAANLIQWM